MTKESSLNRFYSAHWVAHESVDEAHSASLLDTANPQLQSPAVNDVSQLQKPAEQREPHIRMSCK
jgi:hypothetical protein